MEMEEKDLVNNLMVAANELLEPPSSVQQLILLLDKLQKCLRRVEQGPSKCVEKALKPVMEALITKQFMHHSNVDAKVSVASCISEITRITAPESPYNDEDMKDIFQLIVTAFENISDISSPSYRKRILILEIVAKVRLCILMVDLQCESLILDMFKIFLRNLRDDHPDVVFTFMGLIMILTIDEIDVVPLELVSLILDMTREGKQDVSAIARKLGQRVIENCGWKLAPYMPQAVKNLGFPVDHYGAFVSYICEQQFETSKQNAKSAKFPSSDVRSLHAKKKAKIALTEETACSDYTLKQGEGTCKSEVKVAKGSVTKPKIVKADSKYENNPSDAKPKSTQESMTNVNAAETSTREKDDSPEKVIEAGEDKCIAIGAIRERFS